MAVFRCLDGNISLSDYQFNLIRSISFFKEVALLEPDDTFDIDITMSNCQLIIKFLCDRKCPTLTLDNFQSINYFANLYHITDLIYHCRSFIDEKFLESCRHGKLETAKDLYNINVISDYIIDEAFWESGVNQHLSIIKWLHQLNQITDMYTNEVFIEVCSLGNIEIAKFLVENLDIDVNAYFDKAFFRSCEHGHLEITQWLHYNYDINIHTYGSTSSCFNSELPFRLCCKNGKLEVAKWLDSLGVNIHVADDICFRMACSNGHPEVAKWLVSKGNVNIEYSNGCIIDDIFILSCYNGHLEIAQWLYLIENFDKHESLIYFPSICENGHLEIIKWLFSLEIVNTDIKRLPECFIKACTNGHLELVQWLLTIDKFNIEIFRRGLYFSCINGHLEVTKLLLNDELLSVKDIRQFDIDTYTDTLSAICKNGKLEAAKFYMSLSPIASINLESVFINICQSEHLEIAKWIFDQGKIQDLNPAFQVACAFGQIEIAKWLYSIDNSLTLDSGDYVKIEMINNIEMIIWLLSMNIIQDTSIDRDKIFINGFSNQSQNSLKVMRRLYSLGGISDSSFEQVYFYNRYYKLPVRKWLFNLIKITNNNQIFRKKCLIGDLDEMKWLYHKGITVDFGEMFLECLMNKYLDVARWLYSLKKIEHQKDQEFFPKISSLSKYNDLLGIFERKS